MKILLRYEGGHAYLDGLDDALRKKIDDMGLTEIEAADQIGIHPSSLNQLMWGHTPGISIAIRCLNWLGAPSIEVS